MKKYLINKLALTEQGASDVIKSILKSFLVYISTFFPTILLVLFLDELILGNIKDKNFYFIFSLTLIVIMYILLNIEYEALYSTTYKESGNLRKNTIFTLSKLPISYFSKHDLSDLAQTVMSDIEGIEHALSHSVARVGAFVIFFPLVSLMLVLGNYKLGLVITCPLVLKFLFLISSKKIQDRTNNKYYNQLRENSEAFQEAIEMQQEIKSFNLSEKIKIQLDKKMEDSEKIHLQGEKILIIIMGLSQFFNFVSLVLVVLVGIHLYATQEISILFLFTYLLTTMKLKELVDSTSENIAEIFYLSPKVSRINEIRNTDTQPGIDYDIKNFNIEFKNVDFSYEKDRKILNEVNFTALQGEVTALVGPSGCGKTSILKLISRLYDCDNGEIKIDEKNIKEIATSSLFDKISVVFQDVILFNTSILENIRIGKKEASDEEVKMAARLANCEEFILKLENGYNTFIGENGAELSGGERQRLSIARAFLKNSPILILDEISASLDIENEKKIQESLNKLIKNKTVIVISHRLKSIENVDKIVVISNGKIECIGKNEELQEKSATYKNLILKSQLAENFVYQNI